TNSYQLRGNPIALNAGITATNAAGFCQVFTPLLLNFDQTMACTNPTGFLQIPGGVNVNGHTLTTAGAGTISIGATIVGNGGVAKTESGITLLGGTNTYSGLTE